MRKFDLSDKIVDSIQTIALKYPIRSVVLFGSRARGDGKRTSDIDLAVFPLPDFSVRGRFSSEIDDLATLLKIDLVFIDEQTDGLLRERIKQEGVILYERL